ncbi:hypothetical protein [Pedobacter suwonensis]|uniref:hypothetical protein n=1 Tax=Pedobacter suwonensis TaxID=332999 RepID=UPI003D06D326
MPLYQEGNGRQLKRLKYYSMIFKETREYMNASESKVVDSANGVYRFRCMNNTIRNLFVKATVKKHQMIFNSPKRIVLEVRDSSALFWPKDRSKISKWRIENLHSYDLAIPLNMMDSVGSIMMQDLNKFLPYQAKVEKRPTKCLALIKTNINSLFIAKDGTTPGLRTEKDGTLNLSGGTITDLLINGLGELNSQTNLPIVNETGYSGKIDIKLSNRRDIVKVRKELRGYGLDFVEKTINLDMLVIRDKF